MKSLFERALARPYYSTAWLLAAIAAVGVLWWLFCPAASTPTTPKTTMASTTPKTVTNAPIVQVPTQPTLATSTSSATSEATATKTVAAAPAVKTAIPTDPALAEEELDRLNDEHARLKDRKVQLAQQLEISNKLLAMKEQQLKTLETPKP